MADKSVLEKVLHPHVGKSYANISAGEHICGSGRVCNMQGKNKVNSFTMVRHSK